MPHAFSSSITSPVVVYSLRTTGHEPLLTTCPMICRVQVDRHTQIAPQPEWQRGQRVSYSHYGLPHIKARLSGTIYGSIRDCVERSIPEVSHR